MCFLVSTVLFINFAYFSAETGQSQPFLCAYESSTYRKEHSIAEQAVAVNHSFRGHGTSAEGAEGDK